MKRFITFCLALTLVAPLMLGCDNSPAAKKANADKKAVDAQSEAEKTNVDANAKATKENIDEQKKAEEAGTR